MRFLLSLFLSTSCLAQIQMTDLPFLSARGSSTWAGCSATNTFDFNSVGSGTLYTELFTDCTNADWFPSLTTQGTTRYWIDQSQYSMHYSNGPNTSTTWSNVQNSVNSPFLDFSVGSSPNSMRAPTTLSNQPNTILIIAKYPASVSTTAFPIFDVFSGNVEKVGIVQQGVNGYMNAGSTIVLPPILDTGWVCYSFVFNGANSYARTNGVLWASGNAGANSLGRLVIGLNSGQTVNFSGQMKAFLIYNAALNTNDLQSAENQLILKYPHNSGLN